MVASRLLRRSQVTEAREEQTTLGGTTGTWRSTDASDGEAKTTLRIGAPAQVPAISEPTTAINAIAELASRKQWVTWQWEAKEGKRTKVPYGTGSSKASSTNAATWAEFDAALAAARRFERDGVGFVFSSDDPYAGVDLDACIDPDTGEMEPWALVIVRRLNSYTEVSPSGTGVKIWVHAWARHNGNRKVHAELPEWAHGKARAVEMYSNGRYFTVTGNVWPGARTTIEERQDALDWLHEEYFLKPEAAARPMAGHGPAASMEDAALLDKARNSANGAKFRALYDDGAYIGMGDSEATASLCFMLAFWTGNDAAQMDRLIRRSALMREKWDSKRGVSTWGAQEIEKAIAASTQTFIGGRSFAARPVLHIIDPDSLPDFPLTDSGNAEFFAYLAGDVYRFVHGKNAWLAFREHWYEPDVKNAVVTAAKECARVRFRAASRIDDLDRRRAIARFATDSENRRRLENALVLAQSEPVLSTTPEEWNTDPWLIGVENGVLDLRSGQLRPGTTGDLISHHSPIPYVPTAQCPLWLSSLWEICRGDQARIDFLRRAVGYSLTGSTREHVVFILQGTGRNGKSLFLNIIRVLAGGYGANMSFSVLESVGQRATNTFDLAPLEGKRLVTSSETNEGTRLNTARFKSISGGDPVTASHKYQQERTFRPQAKLWLAVNYLPVVDDDSEGMWARIRLIQFDRRFEGPEMDMNLEDKLLLNELPGIFAWAVEGAKEWYRDGLQPPPSVMDSTMEYRDDSDVLAPFLAECCVEHPDARSTPGTLYNAYRTWAFAGGFDGSGILTAATFGTRIGARFMRFKSNGRRYYGGIGLAATPSGTP